MFGLRAQFHVSLVDLALELFEVAIIFNHRVVLLLVMMLGYGLLSLRVGDSWLTLIGQLTVILKGFRRFLLFFSLKIYYEISSYILDNHSGTNPS